jgi:hypothetical protein
LLYWVMWVWVVALPSDLCPLVSSIVGLLD